MIIMTRLEIITKLNEIELRKQQFENLLNDASDYYCETIVIQADLTTTMFKNQRKYENGKSIQVSKDFFSEYLRREISELEIESDKLIEQLV